MDKNIFKTLWIKINRQIIIVMNAPHRYDLSATSCVNNEVLNFNRKLKKRMKIYDHVSIIDPDLTRHHFTRPVYT